MKATDLMIGDWVEVVRIDKDTKKEKTKIGRVTEITPYFDHIGVADNDHDARRNYGVGYPLSCIRPIPLTAEILEKNGFEMLSKHNYRLPNDFAITIVSNIPILCYIDYTNEMPGKSAGMDFVHLSDMPYVHLLQQALRLGGIEKEVVL